MSTRTFIQEVVSLQGWSVLIDEQISAEHYLKNVIKNITAGQNTHIELNQFFLNFDLFRDLQNDLNALEQKRSTLGEEKKRDKRELNDQIDQLKKDEQQVRISILSLALTLNEVRETKKLREIKRNYLEGRLRKVDEIIDVRSLQQFQELYKRQLKEVRQNEEKIKQLSEKLVDNANEFLVKAQVTGINYKLANRFDNSIRFFEKGLISARRAKNKKNLAGYLHTFAVFLLDHEEYTDAIPYFEEALSNYQAVKEEYGKAAYLLTPSISSILESLGLIYQMKGRAEKAIQVLKKAGNIRKNEPALNYFENTAAISGINNLLGSVYYSITDFQNAENAYKVARVLGEILYRLSPSSFSSYLAAPLNNLGELYEKTGKYALAEQQLEEALKILEEHVVKVPNFDLVHLSGTHIKLGSFYRSRMDLGKAGFHFSKALAINRSLFNKNAEKYSSHLGLALNNLSALRIQENQFKIAEELNEEALALFQRLIVDEPEVFLPNYVRTLCNSGIIKTYTQRIDSAKETFEKALEMARQTTTGRSKLILEVRRLMQVFKKEYDLPDISEDLYEESIQDFKQKYQTNQQMYAPGLIQSLNDIADLYIQHEKYEEAKQSLEEALNLSKKNSEQNKETFTPLTVTTLQKFAKLARKQKDYKNAATYLSNAIELHRANKKDSGDNLLELEMCGVLANILEQGKYFELAEEYRQSVLTLLEPLLEKNRDLYVEKYAEDLSSLAGLQLRIKNFTASEENAQKAGKILEELMSQNPERYYHKLARILLDLHFIFKHFKKDLKTAQAQLDKATTLLLTYSNGEHDEKSKKLLKLIHHILRIENKSPSWYFRKIRLKIFQKKLRSEIGDAGNKILQKGRTPVSKDEPPKTEEIAPDEAPPPTAENATPEEANQQREEHLLNAMMQEVQDYMDNEQFEKALPLQQKLIPLLEEHDFDKITIANALEILAFIYHRLNQNRKALDYQHRATNIKETRLDPSDGRLAISYANSAIFLEELGELNQALEFHHQAIRIKENLENATESLASAYYHISKTYHQLQVLDKAVEYLKRVIDIREKVLEENHQDLALSYYRMAVLQRKAGELELALDYQKKALKIFEVLFAPNATGLAPIYETASTIYLDLNLLDEALKCNRRIVDIYEQDPDVTDMTLAQAYDELAYVYRLLKKHEDALEFQKKAVWTVENTFGTDHPKTAEFLLHLSNIYFDMEQYDQVLKTRLKILAIRERINSPMDIDWGHACQNLAYAYQNLRDYEQALKMFRQAAAVFERSPEENNSNLLVLYNQIGLCHYRLKAYEEAIAYYQRSYNPGSDMEAIFHNNVGLSYIRLGAFEKAEANFRKQQALEPDSQFVFLNWSIFYAHKHLINEALQNLEKAIALGFKDWEKLETDENFANIRGEKRYIELIEQLKKKEIQ